MIRPSFNFSVNCILLLHHRHLKSHFSLTWLKEWILTSENFTDDIASLLGISTATLWHLLNTCNDFSRPFEHALSPLCFFIENSYVIKNASSPHLVSPLNRKLDCDILTCLYDRFLLNPVAWAITVCDIYPLAIDYWFFVCGMHEGK